MSRAGIPDPSTEAQEFLEWLASWLDRIDPILRAVFAKADLTNDEHRQIDEWLQGTEVQVRLRALAARLSQAEEANASLIDVLEDLEWSVLPPPLPRCPSCGYMERRGNYYKRPGFKGGHAHFCKLGAALAASSAGETRE